MNMAEEFRDRTFKDGERIETEGRTFVNCNFEKVFLRYAGGPHPSFIDCTFGETGWYFEDAALRTVQLLQANGNGEGGRRFIEELFKPGFYISE
jgi:hypothetical protein